MKARTLLFASGILALASAFPNEFPRADDGFVHAATGFSSPEATPAAAAASSCECDQSFCTFQWPKSCYCENKAKQACFEKCGGAAPVYNTCPSATVVDDTAVITPAVLVTAAVQPLAKTTTSLTAKCALYKPMKCASCFCDNINKRKKYLLCGGPKPSFANCYTKIATKRSAEPTDVVLVPPV